MERFKIDIFIIKFIISKFIISKFIIKNQNNKRYIKILPFFYQILPYIIILL